MSWCDLDRNALISVSLCWMACALWKLLLNTELERLEALGQLVNQLLLAPAHFLIDTHFCSVAVVTRSGEAMEGSDVPEMPMRLATCSSPVVVKCAVLSVSSMVSESIEGRVCRRQFNRFLGRWGAVYNSVEMVVVPIDRSKVSVISGIADKFVGGAFRNDSPPLPSRAPPNDF